jgi:aryl-alcohol dehydrogenase-like predicted oxidoreductase
MTTARADTRLEGHATPEATRRVNSRFANAQPDDFYRSLPDGTLVSSLGFGTYLGECDDAEDARYASTISAALDRGVNLLDTAINYRCQRSERAIGRALRDSIGAGRVKREEVVVSTKGGYIPLDGRPPATREGYREFLDREYFSTGVMRPSDVVSGGHCLTPRYIEDQIERSRGNLGLAVIDIYYLHNPEQQLDVLSRQDFLTLLRDAFATLEDAVRRGVIRNYGCATWNGFRVSVESSSHLNLDELVALAREAGGANHHFRVLQLPVNLAMTEAVRIPNQRVKHETVPLLDAAQRFGIAVIGSATLMQSQLTRSLPAELKSAFPGFATDARRAIAFSQSLPLVSALVGMKSIEHLDENLALPQPS